jgi:transcriptional regulator with XRE-family HTH domain
MKKSTHTPEYRKLREILVQVRTAAQMSQRELAAKLDVPPSWVAKVETGERRIDLIEFCWFLSACGADPKAFMSKIATAKRFSGGQAS